MDRSAAEDVAAEAFARLWSKWGQIEGEDHAGGFVFKTAMRLCRRRTRRSEVLGWLPERGWDGEMDLVLERHEVLRSLSGLPTRQRQAVVLRDWAGMETREVAEALGLAESTVRVHLARGRAALRSVLRTEGSER